MQDNFEQQCVYVRDTDIGRVGLFRNMIILFSAVQRYPKLYFCFFIYFYFLRMSNTNNIPPKLDLKGSFFIVVC